MIVSDMFVETEDGEGSCSKTRHFRHLRARRTSGAHISPTEPYSLLGIQNRADGAGTGSPPRSGSRCQILELNDQHSSCGWLQTEARPDR